MSERAQWVKAFVSKCPESGPCSPHDERREPTPQSYPLPSTCVGWHVGTFTHTGTHTKEANVMNYLNDGVSKNKTKKVFPFQSDGLIFLVCAYLVGKHVWLFSGTLSWKELEALHSTNKGLET